MIFKILHQLFPKNFKVTYNHFEMNTIAHHFQLVIFSQLQHNGHNFNFTPPTQIVHHFM